MIPLSLISKTNALGLLKLNQSGVCMCPEAPVGLGSGVGDLSQAAEKGTLGQDLVFMEIHQLTVLDIVLHT